MMTQLSTGLAPLDSTALRGGARGSSIVGTTKQNETTQSSYKMPVMALKKIIGTEIKSSELAKTVHSMKESSTSEQLVVQTLLLRDHQLPDP
eukprot:1777301-Rhodomonas_salina.3